MTTKQIKPFKRINFFTGFKTTADDWNAAEVYHNKKRKLHNEHLHTPGIIKDFLDNLDVKAAKDEKHVLVKAGCALDPQGRELLLPKPGNFPIKPKEFKPGQTIFVVLRYHELEEQYQKDVNPDYTGYKFINECPEVDLDKSEPSPDDGVEIARMHLDNSGRLNDANIDTSYVRFAGPKITLQNSFELHMDGQTDFSEGMSEIVLERVPKDQPKGVYLVNAYPSEDSGPISWHIEALNKDGMISYKLCITVMGKQTTNVAYQVYKLM